MSTPIDINDVAPRVAYTALAAQTAFAVPFEFFADGDLVVTVDDADQSLGTDYTVSGSETEGGGTVTFTSGLTAGERVVIYSDIPVSRDTQYAQSGNLPHNVLERDFARIIRMLQQQESQTARTVRLRTSDTTVETRLPLAADRANKYLSFGAAGEILATDAISATTTFTQATIGANLYPRTDAEIAAGVTPTYYYYEPGDVRRYGALTATADNSAAIQAAIDQCVEAGGANVFIPNGTWGFASTLLIYSGLVVRGSGQQACILSYTGSAKAFASGNAGVRQYNFVMSDIQIKDDGTGTHGLHLDSFSLCEFTNVLMNGFNYNWQISTPNGQSGYSVYNRFRNCRSNHAATLGWDIGGGTGGVSNNANVFDSCRSNADYQAVKIEDSNDNHFAFCQFEGGTNAGISGVEITGSAPSITTANQFTECRWENNAGAGLDIDANVAGTRMNNNFFISTGGTINDNGDRTIWNGSASSQGIGHRYHVSVGGATDAGFLFSRASNGGAGENAALRIQETITGAGDPITLQVQSERTSTNSRAIQVLNTTASGGGESFGVRTDGRIHTNQYAATATVGSQNGRMPIYNAAGTLLGYIPIYDAS